MPGCRPYTTQAHAKRYVVRGDAYFDAVGQLVFYGRAVTQLAHGPRLIVQTRSIADVTGKAVLPPTPEWLRRMGYSVFGHLPKRRGKRCNLLQTQEVPQTQGLRVLSGGAAPAGGVVAEGR